MKSILLFAAFAASAVAQTTTSAAGTTQSQSMPAVATQDFNIALINATEKATWCSNQQSTCPNICGGRTSSNTCDSSTLQYSCVCFNGTTPDASAFVQTIPFFECQASYANCITENQMNQTGQQMCTDNHLCGTRTALPVGVQVSSTSSASSSASGSATGSAASSAASSATSHAAGAFVGPATNGAFAALLFALWKLAL